MGGNQTPVFEDLEQILSNKTLDDVTLTGTVTLPSAVSTALIISKPSTDGVGSDRLVTFRIEDDDTGSEFSIQNGTGAEGVFVPQLNWKNLSNTNYSGVYVIETDPDNDTGTTPLFTMDFRRTGAALVTRPMIRFANFGTAEYIWSLTEFDMNDNALVNAAIDGDDNTITNIPDTALSDNIALLDTANTFTDNQIIQTADFELLRLYRTINTAGSALINFYQNNDADASRPYGSFAVRSEEVAAGEETGSFRISLIDEGTQNVEQFKVTGGKITIGKSGGFRAVIDPTGITTADKTFTLPDITGDFVIDSNENVFTALQRIELDSDTIMELYRPNSETGDKIGMLFKGDNAATTPEEITYGQFYFSITDDTGDSEDSNFGILSMSAGTLKNRLFISGSNGNLFLGNNQRVILSDSGQTAAHTFTFPDESGKLALDGALGSLDDLTDVDVTTVTPVDNYVLTYSSGTWIAAEAPGASGGEANTLTNVGSENELVKTKVGVNYDIRTLEAGTNVTITQNTDTVTIAATDTNTVTDALTELTTDVSISSPSNNQVLAYNSTSSKWENNSFNSEKTGTATGDGNGSSVEFTVGHDLGSVPSSHFIQCYSHSIPFTWAIDSSDFTVTFDSAPGSGTDNVKFTWRVVA